MLSDNDEIPFDVKITDDLVLFIEKLKSHYLKMIEMIDYYGNKIDSKMKLIPSETFINKAIVYRYSVFKSYCNTIRVMKALSNLLHLFHHSIFFILKPFL